MQYARFGFTYNLTGQQAYIVPGGGGVFYDRPQGNELFDLLGNPPTTLSPTLNNSRLQDLGASGSSLILAPPAITAFDHDSKIPTLHAYNLGVQVKVPMDAVLDISYFGSQSRHLLSARTSTLRRMGPHICRSSRIQAQQPTPRFRETAR